MGNQDERSVDAVAASWLKSSARYLLQGKKKKRSRVAQSQSCRRQCRAFYINREQQIPALRMLRAPFIKMASLLPCKRTNGDGRLSCA